jgi:hypothetical protein
VASFTEDRLIINLIISRDPQDGTDHIFLRAESYDSSRGVRVRTNSREDVTRLMTPDRLAGMKMLLDDAFNYVKAQWQIPVLVSTKTAAPVTEEDAKVQEGNPGAVH